MPSEMKKINNNQELDKSRPIGMDLIAVLVTSIVVTLLNLLVTFTPDMLYDLVVSSPIKLWALFAFSLIIFFTIYVFLLNMEESEKSTKKNLTIVYVAIVITMALVVLAHKFINAYVAPVTLLSIIVTVFIDKKMAVLVNGLFSALLMLGYSLTSQASVSLVLSNEIVASLVDMVVGYFIVFFLRKSSSRAVYLATGVGISLLSAPLSFAGALLVGNSLYDAAWAMLWTIVGNIVAVSMFLVFLPILETVFKTYTDFKLGELCNFRANILKELSIKAPGTFNHCIMVAVLAESCALAIGENPQLAKTCAYYHDVGKLRGPEFFAENQSGKNPHDELIPEVSARKITSHTTDGYEMLTKRGFPEEITSVCLEHHGTMPVSYFYRKADKISDGNAELAQYSYQGPKPRTKIAAIIMLCDASEAAVRAAGHGVPLEKVVEGIFNERMGYGQFDECPVTIADLKLIKETIVDVLSGVYHSRVSYVPKI